MLYWKTKILNMLYSKLLALTLLCMVVVFQSLSHVQLFATRGLQHDRGLLSRYLPEPVQTHVH